MKTKKRVSSTEIREFMKKHFENYEEELEQGIKELKIELLLKDLRKNNGFTQKDVAKLMGTHQTAVSRIEQNPLHVTVRTLLAYLKAIGVNFDILKKVLE